MTSIHPHPSRRLFMTSRLTKRHRVVRGLLLALGLAALPAVALLAEDKKSTPAALPADLAVVPRDAAGFAHVRVGELLATPIGQELLKTFIKENAEGLKSAEKEAGFAFDTVESITVILPTLNDETSVQSVVFVVNFSKPF